MNFAVLTWILTNSSKKTLYIPHWSLPWVSENSCRNALSKSFEITERMAFTSHYFIPREKPGISGRSLQLIPLHMLICILMFPNIAQIYS